MNSIVFGIRLLLTRFLGYHRKIDVKIVYEIVAQIPESIVVWTAVRLTLNIILPYLTDVSIVSVIFLVAPQIHFTIDLIRPYKQMNEHLCVSFCVGRQEIFANVPDRKIGSRFPK